MRNRKDSKLLEKARLKGRNGDTMIAHINPIEAQLLGMFGKGSKNPATGLPEFGFMKSPKKWLAGSAGPMAGAVIGNMIMPRVGGVIGGALGGAAGSIVRGRKDHMQAAGRGAMLGASLPSLASGAGWVADAAGQTGLGTSLGEYGATNAILPSIGLGNEAATTAGSGAGGGASSALQSLAEGGGSSAASEGAKASTANMSFMDKLLANSKEYMTDPKSLLTLAAAGSTLYDRHKQKKPPTASQRGADAKAEWLASMLTPEELARKEAYDLEVLRGGRRNQRNKYVEGERIDMSPLYNRVSTPEEFQRTGRWMNYHDNPEFTGKRINF